MIKKTCLSSEQIIQKVVEKMDRTKKIDFGNSEGYVSFDDIKIKNSNLCREIKSDISKWNGNDFVQYVAKIYHEKTGHELDINVKGCSKEIPVLQDMILDKYKDIDNYITKAYIDFFMEYYLMKFLNKGKPFYFIQLKNKKAIKDFSSNINPKLYNEVKKKTENTNKINSKIIENAYLLDDLSLFLEFGFILGISWLIDKQNYSINKAINTCLKSIKKSNNIESAIKLIERNTNRLSPYPSNLIFKDVDSICNIISENFCYTLSLDIVFNNNIDYNL